MLDLIESNYKYKNHRLDFRAYKDDGKKTFPTTTADTGLYGTSTTGPGGTSYRPTDFQKSLVGTSQEGIIKNLNDLINPTYDSADFNQYKNDLQTQQQHGFENNVVNPLISRGLLGTSGVENLSNMYGNTINQQTSDLMDKYKGEKSSLLSQLLSTYAMPYDMMQGATNLSSNNANSVADFNSKMYAADQATKAAMYGALGTAIGGLGAGTGYALGGINKGGETTKK